MTMEVKNNPTDVQELIKIWGFRNNDKSFSAKFVIFGGDVLDMMDNSISEIKFV